MAVLAKVPAVGKARESLGIDPSTALGYDWSQWYLRTVDVAFFLVFNRRSVPSQASSTTARRLDVHTCRCWIDGRFLVSLLLGLQYRRMRVRAWIDHTFAWMESP